MLKKIALTTTPIAALAVCASMAFGAGATPLHENGHGTFALGSAPHGTAVALSGTVADTPITGDIDGTVNLNFDNATPDSACFEGRVPWTGKVTLTSGATGDQLVKKESGTVCVPNSTSLTINLTGTYTVAGAASTGVFHGAGGTGTANYTLTLDDSMSGTGTFRSIETGVVTLKGGKVVSATAPKTP